jgi:hypothetical protein
MRSQHRHPQHFQWKTAKCLFWMTLVVVFTSAAANRQSAFPRAVPPVHRQDQAHARQQREMAEAGAPNSTVFHQNSSAALGEEDLFLEGIGLPEVQVEQNEEDLFSEGIGLPALEVNHEEKDLYLEGTGLPLAMEVVMLVFGFVSCSLSIIGSACIMYMCYRELDKAMQRLLFLLSISDLILSLAYLMMPFLLPPDLSIVALGSFGSCSAFILIGSCYNTYLSVYYLAVVRYNWKEPKPQYGERAKVPRWELLVHAFTVGIPLVYSSVVASSDAFSPHQFLPVCQVGSYPWGCDDDPNDSLECERASYEVAVQLGTLYALYLGIMTLVGLACSGAVYFTVRNKLKATIQQSFTSSMLRGSSALQGSSTLQGPASSAINAEGNNDENDRFKKRISQVRTQSILYSMSYLNTYFWGLVVGLVMLSGMTSVEIHAKKSEPGMYALQLMAITFAPLQGALNFFIFTRLKVKRWREADPELSMLSIWRNVLANTEIPSPQQVKARKNRVEQQKGSAAIAADVGPSGPIASEETWSATETPSFRR